MKLIFKIMCIVQLIIFCSCQSAEVKDGKLVKALEYSDTIKVSNKYHFKDQVDIFNPFRILNVNDDYLVVSEQRQNDFFHIFSLPNLSYLYSSGKNGRGPNEFMTPPTYINVNKKGIEVYDPILEAMRFLSVSDTAMVEYEKTSLKYTGQMEPLNRLRRINDSTYFADYGSSIQGINKEHIALRLAKEESLFTFGRYPSSDLEGFERYSQFLKTNASSSSGDRFATFYIYHNRFKIFNDSGELLKDLTVNMPHIEVESNSSSNNMYRVTSWASNDFIYLLGIYNSGDKVYDDPDANLKTSIEVWTWEGKPVYRAKFDRLIHGFTVSEDFKKIYGFSYLNESTIFEYNLNFQAM